MKKTKILCLVLAILMLFSLLAGCGSSEKADDSVETSQTEEKSDDTPTEDSDENTEADDDSDEFIVNTSTSGEIIKDYDDINSSKITIDGIEYDFPVKMSDLFDDGWTIPGSENGLDNFDNSFEPESQTNLISFSVINDNKSKIGLGKIYNTSKEVKKIEDCTLTSVDFYDYYNTDYILPGGITNKSTAKDVLEVFGDPNNSSDFVSGYNFSTQLTYENQKNSNLRYSFLFNEDDGTIYHLIIEYEGNL